MAIYRVGLMYCLQRLATVVPLILPSIHFQLQHVAKYIAASRGITLFTIYNLTNVSADFRDD